MPVCTRHFSCLHLLPITIRQHYRDVNSVCIAGAANSAGKWVNPGCYVLIRYGVAVYGSDWRRGHAIF